MPNSGSFTRAQISNVQTVPQAIAELLSSFQGSSFSNITDWGTGTFQQDLLQFGAYMYVAGQQRAATLIVQGVESTASASFLDAISNDFFNNVRDPGSQAIGIVGVTASISAQSNTFAPGQFTITSQGLQFNNVNTLAIVAGSATTAQFTSPVPGIAYNLSNNSAFFPLNPYAGLTLNNPPIAGSSTWLTQTGADQMGDQPLHVLNETKLSLLATAASSPADRVINAVISASAGAISDVQVDGSNPFGPGTVAVYCSFPMAPAPLGEVQAISGTIQQIASFNPSLVTVTSSFGVQFAAGQSSNFPIQVWCAPGTPLPALSSSLNATLNNWLSLVPTGGNDYAGSLQSGAATGIADVGSLLAQLYQVPGVRIVTIGNMDDIQLTAEQKLTAPFTNVDFTGAWPAPYLQISSSNF